MSRSSPKEFGDDVVWVARNRDHGVTLEQIAADFGVHTMTSSKWMRQAGVEGGTNPGTSTTDSADLREARRWIEVLEQENEVLRIERRHLPVRHSPVVARAKLNPGFPPI